MIELRDLSCTFHPGTALEVKALKNISLSIAAGEYVMVVGSNGSGKSTLLNVLAGTVRPEKGSIHLQDENITPLPDYHRSRLIARVFQNPFSGTAGELSILENFRLAALRTGNKNLRLGLTEKFREVVRHEISRLQLGLENNIDRQMQSLSGGQRQALTLLMAVMSPCKLLLMDEPTSALDPRTASMVMRIADDLIRQHQLTTIHITHRMKDAVQYGDRLLMLREGEIIKDYKGNAKKDIRPSEIIDWF